MIAERMQRQGVAMPRSGRSISLGLVADDRAVRSALRQLRRWMAACAAPPDLIGRAELVLAEAMNNIAEHGYHRGERGRIAVQCIFNRAGLRVVLTDSGRAVPLPLLQGSAGSPVTGCDMTPDALPEGGFGWFLIHELTCELTGHRIGEVNRLGFLVPYHGAGSTH